MGIRIQLGEDGKPYADFGTAAEAAEFMRLFSANGTKPDRPSRQNEVSAVSAARSANGASSKDASAGDRFPEDLKSELRKLLILLCESPDGTSTEALSNLLGVDTNQFGAMCTAISKNAKRHKFQWKGGLVTSEPKFIDGKRTTFMKPTPLLLGLKERLGDVA